MMAQSVDLDVLRKRYAAGLAELRAERDQRAGMILKYPDRADYWRGRVAAMDETIAMIEELAAVAGGRLGVNIQSSLFGGGE